MFYYLLALIHIVVCVGLIFFILIQSNKGMGLSGAFGAMGAGDSVFGSSGGMNILIKITIGLSLVFALSTVMLSVIRPPAHSSTVMSEFSNQPQSTSDMIQQSQSAPENQPVPPAQGDQNAENPAPAEK